jgi:hypothetical protein
MDEDLTSQSTFKSPQELEKAEEKKKTLARFLVLGAVIFLAVFYFVWGAFLNFGTLEVYGDPSFDVMIFDGQTYNCDTTPCEIKLPRGEKIVMFYKPGYSAENIPADVPLWSRLQLYPEFILNPYMEEIELIPELRISQINPEYRLQYDEPNHKWQLVEKEAPTSISLTYFPEKLKSPLIFGSDDSVLIVEQDENKSENPVYFIDTITKTRDQVTKTNSKILKASPSPNGSFYLLLTETPPSATAENDEPSQNLVVAEKNTFTTLTPPASYENTVWTNKNTLALTYKREGKQVFSIYDPQKGTTRELLTASELSEGSEITNFFSSSKGNRLYFQAGESYWQLVY